MTTTWEITKNEIKRSQQPTQTLTNSTQRINHIFTALLTTLIKAGGTIFGKPYRLNW